MDGNEIVNWLKGYIEVLVSKEEVHIDELTLLVDKLNGHIEDSKNENIPHEVIASERFEDDSDSYYDDNYGSSYEQYGGYNGFSDDVINDAFEGDPELTWNVD